MIECEAVLNSQMKGSVQLQIIILSSTSNPQVFSGFEVLQFTNYMLSRAIWNWPYLYKVRGWLARIVNVVSSPKLSAHVVVPNGQERETQRRAVLDF